MKVDKIWEKFDNIIKMYIIDSVNCVLNAL
jgi:hypothetical protein